MSDEKYVGDPFKWAKELETRDIIFYPTFATQHSASQQQASTSQVSAADQQVSTSEQQAEAAQTPAGRMEPHSYEVEWTLAREQEAREYEAELARAAVTPSQQAPLPIQQLPLPIEQMPLPIQQLPLREKMIHSQQARSAGTFDPPVEYPPRKKSNTRKGRSKTVKAGAQQHVSSSESPTSVYKAPVMEEIKVVMTYEETLKDAQIEAEHMLETYLKQTPEGVHEADKYLELAPQKVHKMQLPTIQKGVDLQLDCIMQHGTCSSLRKIKAKANMTLQSATCVKDTTDRTMSAYTLQLNCCLTLRRLELIKGSDMHINI